MLEQAASTEHGDHSCFASTEVRMPLQSGRLSMLPTEVADRPDGEFDADTRLNTYADLTRAARREGFAGLWVTGDATPVATDPRAMERFASNELRAGVLLTLDVSEVSSIDVAGMRALETAARAVEEAVVVSASDAFRHVWDVLRWSEQGSALRVVERGQSR